MPKISISIQDAIRKVEAVITSPHDPDTINSFLALRFAGKVDPEITRMAHLIFGSPYLQLTKRLRQLSRTSDYEDVTQHAMEILESTGLDQIQESRRPLPRQFGRRY